MTRIIMQITIISHISFLIPIYEVIIDLEHFFVLRLVSAAGHNPVYLFLRQAQGFQNVCPALGHVYQKDQKLVSEGRGIVCK